MIEAITAISSSVTTAVTPVTVNNDIGISELFASKLHEVDNSISVAESNLASMVSGENIATHDVMLSMEKAKMQLGLVVEIRNKLLEAYQEVSRMQI